MRYLTVDVRQKMDKVTVVARSFQKGAGVNGKRFDPEHFNRFVREPISKLFCNGGQSIDCLVVIVNSEAEVLGEQIDSTGMTPTMVALHDAFPSLIGKNLIVESCPYWGPNPGSAVALNDGLRIAHNRGSKWVFNWSTETAINGFHIQECLKHATRNALPVVGYLRKRWWERPQWAISQNTASIWEVEKLLQIDGFSTNCDNSGRTVTIQGFGDISVAGMEDFHAMLRMMKRDSKNFRWGMVGTQYPIDWNIDFNDDERLLEHRRKVARQYEVMKTYCGDIFPGLTSEVVIDRLFTAFHLD